MTVVDTRVAALDSDVAAMESDVAVVGSSVAVVDSSTKEKLAIMISGPNFTTNGPTDNHHAGFCKPTDTRG